MTKHNLNTSSRDVNAILRELPPIQTLETVQWEEQIPEIQGEINKRQQSFKGGTLQLLNQTQQRRSLPLAMKNKKL